MNYRHIFIKLDSEVPVNLAENIAVKVDKYQKRRKWLRLSAHSLLSVFTLGACVPIFQSLIGSLSTSGFFNYLSLLGSDSAYVWSHKSSYFYSLADSLPITGAIVLTIILTVLALSLRSFFNDVKKFNYQHKTQVA